MIGQTKTVKCLKKKTTEVSNEGSSGGKKITEVQNYRRILPYFIFTGE